MPLINWRAARKHIPHPGLAVFQQVIKMNETRNLEALMTNEEMEAWEDGFAAGWQRALLCHNPSALTREPFDRRTRSAKPKKVGEE